MNDFQIYWLDVSGQCFAKSKWNNSIMLMDIAKVKLEHVSENFIFTSGQFVIKCCFTREKAKYRICCRKASWKQAHQDDLNDTPQPIGEC